VKRIVAQIRKKWPAVEIILRGDGGFSRDAIMSWCEENGVEFLFGLAKNKRLLKIIGKQLQEAKVQFEETKKAARLRRWRRGPWTRNCIARAARCANARKRGESD
jgi:hypothetical protein